MIPFNEPPIYRITGRTTRQVDAYIQQLFNSMGEWVHSTTIILMLERIECWLIKYIAVWKWSTGLSLMCVEKVMGSLCVFHWM